jgi:hypothetical protein
MANRRGHQNLEWNAESKGQRIEAVAVANRLDIAERRHQGWHLAAAATLLDSEVAQTDFALVDQRNSHRHAFGGERTRMFFHIHVHQGDSDASCYLLEARTILTTIGGPTIRAPRVCGAEVGELRILRGLTTLIYRFTGVLPKSYISKPGHANPISLLGVDFPPKANR